MIPFALSLSKPFDKLKANGFRFCNKSCRINGMAVILHFKFKFKFKFVRLLAAD